MARVTAFILLFSYSLLSAGHVVIAHYCGDRLVSLKMDAGKKETEKCVCGHSKPKSCCTTDTKTTTPEDQKLSILSSWSSPDFVALPVYFDTSYLPFAFNGITDIEPVNRQLITGDETYPPPYKRYLRLLI